MRIAIAADHAAVAHKQALIAHLTGLGHDVTNFGTDTEQSCDYPDYAIPAAASVIAGTCERVVLICGTGIGMSIAANKVRGIRCALAHSVDTARLAASHNQAQALALGARIVDVPTAIAMVDTWLSSPFETRHQRRLDKMTAYEDSCGLG